jgi:hypothetical protein
VPERSGEESVEQRLRRLAELGRLLAAAGYRVVASDGTHLGWLDHVRYERHADHPDQIIVRRRGLLPKRRALPFDAVEAVRPWHRTIVLRLSGLRLTVRRQPERQPERCEHRLRPAPAARLACRGRAERRRPNRVGETAESFDAQRSLVFAGARETVKD